ncbi:hypothetical protein ER45_030680 (plasmid) [Bacillus mycoides]|nr:hypothetical protein ER45_030680 [Bacillus mycoides]
MSLTTIERMARAERKSNYYRMKYVQYTKMHQNSPYFDYDRTASVMLGYHLKYKREYKTLHRIYYEY